MKSKAVVNITLRIVVAEHGANNTSHAIDDFLNRALQSDLPPELYTEGLIATKLIDHHVIHEWEE